MKDEWELLRSWQSGDEGAGRELVADHFPAISRFFRAKIGDDVEDLVQQTFLACVEARQRISGKSFRSYLFGIASRRLYSHLRGRYKDQVLDFAVSSLEDLATTPSETVARGQRAVVLHNALRQLPLESQLTLELAYWEDLSAAEIAEALGIEPGSVRSRLSRARDKLRVLVEQLGGDANALFGVPELS